MRFGFAVPAYGPCADGAAIRDLLVAADELGYDTAWFPDHIAVPDYATEVNLRPPFLEPLAMCAWGAGLTRRLRFGTDVLVAPYRHPLLVSAMAGTLGRMAGDRLVLGVGVGYLKGEFEVLGAEPYETRGAVTDAFLRAVRVPPDGVTVVTSPTPVPIWVGGNGTKARHRAALLGDGWHPLWMPDSEYAAARRDILSTRESAGLTGPFAFSYSCGTTKLLRGRPGQWPSPAERPPVGSEFRYAPAPWVNGDGRPRFVGTVDDLVSDFRLLEVAGVEQVTLRFGTVDVADLESFAAEIVPHFGPAPAV
jgi:alkanesulfonate monooxygenase SsuD/methylene tetrahydromethanopterin reductase-like flavin-dependent oxidoreductase (luciferase family)